MDPRRVVFVVLLCIGMTSCLFGQVDTLWVRKYSGTQLSTVYGGGIIGDALGNVYVAGQAFDNFGDYLVLKYNAAGVLQWARTYDGPGGGQDQPHAITLDPFGNVIVTGHSHGGSVTDADYCTIKYNSNGDSLWVRRHNGYPASPFQPIDVATAVVTDDSGSVYVTGWGPGPNSPVDVFTIKYSPDGDSLWGQYYNFPATNGGDRAWAMVRDAEGNIIVAGQSWGGTQIPPATNDDYLLLKYSSSGAPLSVRRQQASAAPGGDAARAVATDSSNNIYLTGYAQEGAWYVATFRFNQFTDSVWQQNATGLQGKKIAVDHKGGLYVAGETYEPNFLLIKYLTSGAFQWSVQYDNGGSDQLFDMKIDAAGNVYITGASGGAFDGDFATVKYDSSGQELWVKRYDSGVGGDIPIAIHIFEPGEFAVTGFSLGEGMIVTVRYSENIVSVNEQPKHEIPLQFSLEQNFPNPFNPSTVIGYSIPFSNHVKLHVFDLLGREIATLTDDVKPAGYHSVRFDSSNLSGGVYLYTLAAGEFRQTKKMVLLK